MSGKARALLAALALAAAGFSPFLREEPNVREGNERIAAGDAAAALPHYDTAERAAGARAEIDHDRGVALYRQGRTEDARDAWRRARASAPGPLASRASQNLGNALAALGDREGAVEAFVEALRQDPRNEDARFNLEVLLRKKEQDEQQRPGEPQRPGQRGQQDRRPKEERAQQQARKEEATRTAEPTPRGEPERPDQTNRRDAERPDDAARDHDGASQPTGRMSRHEAERMLDALRSRERVLPPAGPKRRSFWRSRDDPDW